MPRFDLEKLPFGKHVHDMHDGFPDLKELFGPNVYPAYAYKLALPNGTKVIQAMLSVQFHADPTKQPGIHCTYPYTNKMLVLVAIDQEDNEHGTVFQFAYSYDNTRMGIIGVAVKD